MPTAARALPLLLPMLMLAGCTTQGTSSGKFKGDQKAVAGVVSDLQTAAQGHKADTICSDILSRKLADSLKSGGGDCVREIDKAVRDVDDTELKVLGVTVTGATAQARVKARIGGRSAATALGFAREDGKWRLSSIG